MVEIHSHIWVCVCCMLTHANGECCPDDEHGGDGIEPWATTDQTRFDVAMGGEHDDTCPNYHYAQLSAGSHPVEAIDCDCETITYSTSQCEGCGSYLHGERHAMTLFIKGS